MLAMNSMLMHGGPPESPIVLKYVSTHTRKSSTVSASASADELQCRLCEMNFGKSTTEHRQHINVHRDNSIMMRKIRGTVNNDIVGDSELKASDDSLQLSTCLFKLCPVKGNLKLTCNKSRITASWEMLLQNIGTLSVHLTDLYMFNNDVAIAVLDSPETIAPGENLEIILINASNHARKENKFVARYLLMSSQTELIELHRLDRCCSLLARNSLESRAVPEEAFDPKRMGQDLMPGKKDAVVACQLTPSNYVDTFTRLIRLEEYAIYLDLLNANFELTLTSDTLRKLSACCFAITIPNVALKFPLLGVGDQFLMFHLDQKRKYVHATVTEILTSELIVEVRKRKPIVLQPYNIHFLPNRSQVKLEIRALKIMQQFKLAQLLFPIELPPLETGDLEDKRIYWFNDNINKNPEQRQAVLAIVNGVYYPAPFLLFGPPGTGKTATVTEAICQLLRMQPTSRILVTASSNAAADELALRLLRYLRNGCYFEHNCYRLYAACVRREVCDEQLLDNSNYGLGILPGWAVLSKYRVIVCTLTTAGRLNLKPPLSSAKHFTHLFVDECGSATEAAVLVPIANCSSMECINVRIILSGDPKQLGPVIRSCIADRMGLGQSLIERLMNRRKYQRNEITQNYCSRMLTQLLQNFRSHPDIINISNDLFYDGKLLARAPKERSHCCVGWYFLPMRSVPILFDVTLGHAQKEKYSTSWYNNKEVESVVHYVNLLLKYGINGKTISEDDIGIISPYKCQCHKIEMALKNRGHQKIMIASVELFQGREKPVIIVSTVRTGRQGIGFLDSPKRLNVLLTRAQALMILIGDPNVLQKDPNWYDVLERLTRLRVMTGSRFVLSPMRPSAVSESDNKNSVENLSKEVAALRLPRN